MPALEARIFEIVQEERQRINPAARPLALDSELLTIAREHSADMAAKNYFAHRAPDGTTSASLIMAKDQDFQGLLGENLAAQHYVKQSGVDVETFARRFVDTWLASPAHKENLSYGAYDRSAVGAAVGGNTIYVTELFATDLGLKPNLPDSRKRAVGAWNNPGPAATPPLPGAAPAGP